MMCPDMMTTEALRGGSIYGVCTTHNSFDTTYVQPIDKK